MQAVLLLICAGSVFSEGIDISGLRYHWSLAFSTVQENSQNCFQETSNVAECGFEIRANVFDSNEITGFEHNTSDKILAAVRKVWSQETQYNFVSVSQTDNSFLFAEKNFTIPSIEWWETREYYQYGVYPNQLPSKVRKVFISLENNYDIMEVCACSHLVKGGLSVCSELTQAKRSICDSLSKSQCPKSMTRKITLNAGDALIIDSGIMKRRLAKSELITKFPILLNLELNLDYLWKQVSLFPSSPTDSCEDEYLFFGNVNVEGQDIALFYGDSDRIGDLGLGSNLTLANFRYGIYTLRIEEVTRKIWNVTQDNLNTIFYACKDNLDFPTGD